MNELERPLLAGPRAVVLLALATAHQNDMGLLAVLHDAARQNRPDRKILAVIERVPADINAAASVHPKDGVVPVGVPLHASVVVDVPHADAIPPLNGQVQGRVLSAAAYE